MSQSIVGKNIFDFMKDSFLNAVRESNLKIVHAALYMGVPADSRGLNTGTPLHYAAEIGHYEIVQELLNHKADVNAVDETNLTPLHLAACGSNEKVIDLLLRSGAHIDAQDNEGYSPINYALMACEFGSVIQLIKCGAKLDIQRSLETRDVYGLTVLHWAVIEGDVNILAKLMKHSLDINVTIGEGCNFECHIPGEPVRSLKGMTSLHLASLMGYTEIVNLLLDNDADPNLKNHDSEVPLSLAMHVGEITLILKDNMQTKMLIDTVSHTNIIYGLLFGSVIESMDIGKMTPLLRATSKGLVTTVTQLMHKKANLQATDQNQNTALHLASSMGHLEIAKELIEHRAEINVVNSNNETPLILAIQNGHQEIVDKLLANGATLNVSKLMPNNNCSLCFNPKKGTFAFLPCGHANACESCCVKVTFSGDRNISKCPICRTNVTHFQKIYV